VSLVLLELKPQIVIINIPLEKQLSCCIVNIISLTLQQDFIYTTMSTYRQLTYMVLDELKLVSDDSHFTKEHIMSLLNWYRLFILKQRYSDIKKQIPDSNYQTICIDLEPTNAIDGSACEGPGYMKSIQEIPDMITLSVPKVSPIDYFQGNFAYVNRERFKYVGSNRFLRNQIYSTIAPDNHLYMKSNNPQIAYLKKVKVTGIFEDTEKAAELQCPDEAGDTACDTLDKNFPLEDALVPVIVELVVKELSGAKYQPKDNENNANDDLATIASYVRSNLKSPLAKQMT